MEENLILEGLLSMVTELKEKQEQQVKPIGCYRTAHFGDTEPPHYFRKHNAGDSKPNRQYQEKAI